MGRWEMKHGKSDGVRNRRVIFRDRGAKFDNRSRFREQVSSTNLLLPHYNVTVWVVGQYGLWVSFFLPWQPTTLFSFSLNKNHKNII